MLTGGNFHHGSLSSFSPVSKIRTSADRDLNKFSLKSSGLDAVERSSANCRQRSCSILEPFLEHLVWSFTTRNGEQFPSYRYNTKSRLKLQRNVSFASVEFGLRTPPVETLANVFCVIGDRSISFWLIFHFRQSGWYAPPDGSFGRKRAHSRWEGCDWSEAAGCVTGMSLRCSGPWQQHLPFDGFIRKIWIRFPRGFLPVSSFI